jgi:D-alanyl-lipoteichoic acid acyltransferase DltB (MBOAT superfamily)
MAGGRVREDLLKPALTVKVSRGRRGRPGYQLTLSQYLRFRLGSKGGRTAWFNFFIRPFGAASFAQFWRLWNPVYGYFLYYYSYRPLSRILPRAAAVLATVVVCGFLLHDLPAWAFARKVLPPGATIAFVLFGIGAVVGEWFHMDLSRWPVLARAAVNVGYISGCIGAMLLIVRFFETAFIKGS